MCTSALSCGSATNYIQSFQIYKKLEAVGSSMRSGMIKTFNAVLPRNPVNQRRELRLLPTCVENALGDVYYDDVCPKHRIARQSSQTERVSQVFNKLVEECVRNLELNFEIRVMQDDTTVNAFCLPGGKVVITTAMLNKLEEKDTEDLAGEFSHLSFEDKLAAVLGHEISHACAGHGRRSLQFKLISCLGIKAVAFTLECFLNHKAAQAIEEEKQTRPMTGKEEKVLLRKAQDRNSLCRTFFEQIGNVISFFTVLSHGRSHELEADKYGIKIAAKANYNPAGAVWLQRKFLAMKGEEEGVTQNWFGWLFNKSIDLFSTHPPSSERLKANIITVQTIEQDGIEAIYPLV